MTGRNTQVGAFSPVPPGGQIGFNAGIRNNFPVTPVRSVGGERTNYGNPFGFGFNMQEDKGSRTEAPGGRPTIQQLQSDIRRISGDISTMTYVRDNEMLPAMQQAQSEGNTAEYARIDKDYQQLVKDYGEATQELSVTQGMLAQAQQDTSGVSGTGADGRHMLFGNC